MPEETDATAQLEIGRLANLDILEEREIVCEFESAWKRLGEWHGRLGALVLTDRRLLFVATSLITRQTRVESIRLATISEVAVFDSPRWGDERGAIVVRATDPLGPYQFERIRGGSERAEELTRSIVRQRDLHRGVVEAKPAADAEPGEPASEIPIGPHITLGRGVADYVHDNGGTLYVWGRPSGPAFLSLRADTARPHGKQFERLTDITEFELYLDRDLLGAARLRLARRWWLPRGGVVVDSGLVVDT